MAEFAELAADRDDATGADVAARLPRRWLLYDFHGPGDYPLMMEDRTLAISVDADGVFEVTEREEKGFPFYAFAAIVGSKRDVVTRVRLRNR